MESPTWSLFGESAGCSHTRTRADFSDLHGETCRSGWFVLTSSPLWSIRSGGVSSAKRHFFSISFWHLLTTVFSSFSSTCQGQTHSQRPCCYCVVFSVLAAVSAASPPPSSHTSPPPHLPSPGETCGCVLLVLSNWVTTHQVLKGWRLVKISSAWEMSVFFPQLCVYCHQ